MDLSRPVSVLAESWEHRSQDGDFPTQGSEHGEVPATGCGQLRGTSPDGSADGTLRWPWSSPRPWVSGKGTKMEVAASK